MGGGGGGGAPLKLPSVTLQPSPVTLQPPPVTLQAPSVALQPPSVTLPPPGPPTGVRHSNAPLLSSPARIPDEGDTEDTLVTALHPLEQLGHVGLGHTHFGLVGGGGEDRNRPPARLRLQDGRWDGMGRPGRHNRARVHLSAGRMRVMWGGGG